ncbi:MAG: hypothetical protein U1C96_06825 [Gallionella sp.]|nr:hypothetical protein [Gallionella sp.]
MNFKLIIPAVLVVGALVLFETKPAELLDHAGDVMGKFTSDLSAIFNGDAEDNLAKEIRGSGENNAQVVYESSAAPVDDEVSAIARDINRDRKEAAKTEKVINVSADELKRRIEDQKMQIE